MSPRAASTAGLMAGGPAGPSMASISAFLNVQDIQRSLAFYEELGFEEIDRYETDDGVLHFVDLELDGAILGLGNIESNDDPSFQDWVSGTLGGGVVLYITVDDVDAVYERAQQADATIEHGPEDRSYGRVFTMNDPDGYVVGFIDPS